MALAKLEKETTQTYMNALTLEESMLKQKSRVKWLQLGDGNNSFFYISLMIRRNKNQILHIKARDGSILESEEICEEAVEYFKSLLAPQPIDNPTSNHV